MFEETRSIENPHTEPLDLWFEPWGRYHSLGAGESLRIVGRSPEAGELEVVAQAGAIVVYGWVGSTLRVYSGDELVLDFPHAVPGLPPGMSTRSFVGTVFGGPGEPARSCVVDVPEE